ncbi:hypothetical protein KX816_02035 [Sphingosinicellaceae bacterium]|nr:hypothetical protein KX816_02035 [Sphingosinicellaceae bacterium]
MPAIRLLVRLVLYYAALAAIVGAALWLNPELESYLPIGRVQALIAQADGAQPLASLTDTSHVAATQAYAGARLNHMASFGGSLIWLVAAVAGSLIASLPVSWVYMKIRNPGDYDQSLIDTIVVLPLVVTSIVVVVQNSLALSFSLAGIAGAARYRNTLKSSGDLLFILLAIGIGLSAGIGAVELAIVSSAAFNFCFVALWFTNYGERADMKRFLGEFEHPGHGHHVEPGSTVTTTTAMVAEVIETVETRPAAPVIPDLPSR